MAEAPLTEEDGKKLAQILEGRHGRLTLIPVEGNPAAIIVKTNNHIAPLLRNPDDEIVVGGKRVVSVLTSGAIGKLKSRAKRSGSNEVGQVP